jgi:hypothetical protein
MYSASKEWEVDRKYCIGRVLERVGLQRCRRLNRRQTGWDTEVVRLRIIMHISWLTRGTQDSYTCRRRRTTSSTVIYVLGTWTQCFSIKRMISSKV